MKITISALLRSSLIITAFAAISGCGQKGPLVLDQVPVEQTQSPLENSTDQIPVETATDSDAEEASKPE